jgi:hypothetical protein
MGLISSIGSGFRALFSKRRVESELDEELAAFAEAAAADHLRRGMSLEGARRAALSEIGSRNVVKHRVWSSRWESRLEGVLQDLRIGFRSLIKTPGFTAVALASLALGIGANTAIFTLINAVLLRPLPVPHPEQLYLLGKGTWVGSVDEMPNRSWQLYSYRFFKDFSAQTQSFSGVAAQSSIQMSSHIVLGGGAAEQVRIDLVSGSYFNVLGVPPALGRVIGKSDDGAPDASPVAVASWDGSSGIFKGILQRLGNLSIFRGVITRLSASPSPASRGSSLLSPLISGFRFRWRRRFLPDGTAWLITIFSRST